MQSSWSGFAGFVLQAVVLAAIAYAVVFSIRKAGKARETAAFPDLRGRILFEETSASGRSLRSWQTKIGGAKNCLKIVVTEFELQTASTFTLAPPGTDELSLGIPLSSIVDAQARYGWFSKSIVITYRDLAAQTHAIELMPKNLDLLVATLRERNVNVN